MMKYSLQHSKTFRKDLKKLRRRAKDITKLQHILRSLQHDVTLLPQQRKHELLMGKYKHTFNVHIESDWLLIYRLVGDCLTLLRTGTHADIF
jgi:mRNA interferase YafQ